MGNHPATTFANQYDTKRNLFDSKMNSLKEQFGHNKFSDERCNIIFDEIKQNEDFVILKVFNDLIANAKFAPTLKDFQESLSRIRENVWSVEKQRETREIKNFFSDEQVGKFFGAIAQSIETGNKNGVDDALKSLEQIWKMTPGAVSGCKHCGNSGVVYVKKPSDLFKNLMNEYAYRCRCEYGNQHFNLPFVE